MSKDRARPFSRKHRKYWIPVTGGMLLIGLINVTIGLCSYTAPGAEPQPIQLVLPPPTPPSRANGQIGLGEVPAAVMHAFAVTYPRHIAAPRKLDATTYELSFTDGARTRVVTYRDDGTFLGEK